MRFIDADELMELYDGCDGLSAPIAVVRQNIEDALTIDAESVRHGLWIDRHVTDFGVAEEFCGRCEEWSVGWHKRYCPNCGAKMDGKDNT